MSLRPNRFKLRYLPGFKLSACTDSRSSSEYIDFCRYKTQPHIDLNFIFSSSKPNHRKQPNVLHIDSQQQYRHFRQQQLKNQPKPRLHIKKQHVHLSPHKKYQPKIPTQSHHKQSSIQIFSNEAKHTKIKCLAKNLIHLNIQMAFSKLSVLRVQLIKQSMLSDSDLNEIELLLKQPRDHAIVKQMIFHQRILVLLLVQIHISKRYKQYQNQLKQLFRQLLQFYSILYQQLSQHTQINNSHSLSTSVPLSQPKNHQSFSCFSLSSIRDIFTKKIIRLTNQFGAFNRFIHEQLSILKQSSTNLLYYNILEFYAVRLVGSDWSGCGIQFLQTCPSPYIHHASHRKYTLLLDLDQTLVHYRKTSSTKGEFLLRPFLFQFLRQLQPYFEIGIFTCAMEQYAKVIIDHLPSIDIKLYRQHAIRMNGQLVKDLNRVGRNLSNIILVDNLQKNFRLHKQNGIHVRTWVGDINDRILQKLGQQLCKLANDSPEDIRLSAHNRSFL